MAVNEADTEPQLIRALYDDSLNTLAAGKPFYAVLAGGAASAAVAREYGHRNNVYNNNSGLFTGNDDFAREFHQLFFQINGVTEDPDYHENVTIEHTAWLLTGMKLDRDPSAYGFTLAADQWIAPIDFTDHVDAADFNLRNSTLHHQGDLEIYHQTIGGVNAEEKLANLAAVAIMHPESLDNMPVTIVNFFADDNLTGDKRLAIRNAWRSHVGQPNDLLDFLREYATSKEFHRVDTYKFRTGFMRNLTLNTAVTVDNEEAYRNNFSPRANMLKQGAVPFVPEHDVFGGQTSINAANNPDLFMRAYNVAVDTPQQFGRVSNACNDTAGNRLWTWTKDWARIAPRNADGTFHVGEVGAWLWSRLIADGGANYSDLERAYVTAYLATGQDFSSLANPANPDAIVAADWLASASGQQLIASTEGNAIQLDSAINADRREANRRMGLAVHFISMTPFAFAVAGDQPLAPVVDPKARTVSRRGTLQTVSTDQIVFGGQTAWLIDRSVVRLGRRVQALAPGVRVSGRFWLNPDGTLIVRRLTAR